ncbi:uncharacterized protein PV07_08762 [Cladophialophora immunda]|uniref:Alpha/beta hydrolase domain-containing protein n=1 Tax=Cladophialophora immunda TaxID=569365 RepID=A0A0D1ZCX5_9EURO|nr:uncharacterized protein PV07_08762 [Cladophialophora immunda]KIW25596.1 hypothetical protein PV07_08762 [Cladophialophora immunda]OQV07699.1 hypothetical protein CLAIMM_12098 [Cladophialophora immunda]
MAIFKLPAGLITTCLTTAIAMKIMPPTAEGPIKVGARGHPFCGFPGNMSTLGYLKEEYFISGIANRYNVAVSAQSAGLDCLGANPIGLTEWDPQRYGTLRVPDDALSYDIFTQAAHVFQSGQIAGVEPEKLIAVGASQSGKRVLAYVNDIQPMGSTFDSIIPVVCTGNAANFSPVPAARTPLSARDA